MTTSDTLPPAPFDRLLGSAIEAIGNTPLVELGRLTRGVNGRILAKLDYLNPGFSKKDRIARQLIEAHGGEIVAQNREDTRGSRFSIRIPIGETMQLPSEATA